MKWGIVLGWILLVAQGGGVRGGVLSEGSLETRLLRDRPTVGNGIREERLFEAGIASYLRDLLVKFPTGPALRDGLSPNVGEHCLGHTLEWILQLTQLLNGTSPDLWALHSKSALSSQLLVISSKFHICFDPNNKGAFVSLISEDSEHKH